MKHVVVMVIFAGLATSATLLAQRPDFSGDRTLNRSASRLSQGQTAVQSGRLQIDHRDPNLHVHLTLVTAERTFETDTVRTTDGREVRVAQASGTVASSARWEDDVILLLTNVEGPGCSGSIRIRYALEDGGRRVVATEAIRGCGRDQDNIWVFDK
jgi:hypothetical protein